MATTTPNFGWDIPQSTDLVKDGATAIAALGNDIDTSMVDLKGGTTGQVLSKASNTDMDFTWVTSDDANAIQNTIVDAKGDLISATAADTPARLAVGNNGETLVADSSASTGLRWQNNFSAGKNKIINGDFGIWQRGTSFTITGAGGFQYTADRFYVGGNCTVSRQTFTAGTAPVAGYEGQYFARWDITSNSANYEFIHRIESARTLAGQKATISFWAKLNSGTTTFSAGLVQNFGTGGSPSSAVSISGLGSFTPTGSWQRFSWTVDVPSVAGKTFGTNNNDYLYLTIQINNTATGALDLWGFQIEAGNTATAFQTATGTIQGEFQACCRYYQRFTSPDYGPFFFMTASSATNLEGMFPFMSPMRTAPSFAKGGTAFVYPPLLDKTTFYQAELYATTTGKTAQYTYKNNNGSGDGTSYLEFSAEL